MRSTKPHESGYEINAAVVGHGARERLDLFGGIEKEIDVSLIDEPRPGDWVIVHVGFALNRIDEAQAAETLELLRTTGAADAASDATKGAAQ